MKPIDIIQSLCHRTVTSSDRGTFIEWNEQSDHSFTASIDGIKLLLFKSHDRTGSSGVLILSNGINKVTIIQPAPHTSAVPAGKIQALFSGGTKISKTPEEEKNEELRIAFNQLFSGVLKQSNIHELPEASTHVREGILHKLGL